MKKYDRGLVWFRRDLRVSDQAALYHALKSCKQVWCAFVFDRDILDPLPRADRRVEFIHAALLDLDGELRALGQAHGHGVARQFQAVVHSAHRAQQIVAKTRAKQASKIDFGFGHYKKFLRATGMLAPLMD